MEVSQAIHTKRAVRKFKTQKLSEADIKTILNAGRRAQSAKNMQPWRFIAIQNGEILKKLSELGTYAGHLAGAALGVAILTIDPDNRWSVMFNAVSCLYATGRMGIRDWFMYGNDLRTKKSAGNARVPK
jgi:nitroreductase